MKQTPTPPLIITLLLAIPLTMSVAAQSIPKADEVKTRAAEFQAREKEIVVKLRPGTRVVVGDKTQPLEFIHITSLSGRIKEMRENDFIFSGKSSRTGEITAIISYTDVLSIGRPSGFEKAFRKVGKYTLRGIEIPVAIPLYTIMALLGQLPEC